MTVIDVSEQGTALDDLLARAHDGKVLLTRDGKPAAVLTSVEGLDLEQIATASDPEFWRMINERRQQPTVTLVEARESLGI